MVPVTIIRYGLITHPDLHQKTISGEERFEQLSIIATVEDWAQIWCKLGKGKLGGCWWELLAPWKGSGEGGWKEKLVQPQKSSHLSGSGWSEPPSLLLAAIIAHFCSEPHLQSSHHNCWSEQSRNKENFCSFIKHTFCAQVLSYLMQESMKPPFAKRKTVVKCGGC